MNNETLDTPTGVLWGLPFKKIDTLDTPTGCKKHWPKATLDTPARVLWGTLKTFDDPTGYSGVPEKTLDTPTGVLWCAKKLVRATLDSPMGVLWGTRKNSFYKAISLPWESIPTPQPQYYFKPRSRTTAGDRRSSRSKKDHHRSFSVGPLFFDPRPFFRPPS